VKLFRDARTAAGLPQSPHICRLYEVACAAREDEAFRRAAPHLLEKYASYAAWGLAGVSKERGGPPEEQLRRLAAGRFAVGTPAQVADELVAQHRAGITHLSMRVSWPGMPQDDILAGIEILGREVMPEVRRRTA
jgi:alkanesulfonate monooxygenase SsuD/methylene tetrahydromethanopterin reductase-like flavin-dependent oxidoreductase (luciferase family)